MTLGHHPGTSNFYFENLHLVIDNDDKMTPQNHCI